MTRRSGTTTEAPIPVAAYSQAVRIANTVSVAGQGGFDVATGQLVGSGVAEQCAQTFKNIAACLATVGATMDDVIRVDVYLSDVADFAQMNDVYTSIFNPPYPTRTTFGVELPAPGMKIEITVLAIVE